MWYVYKQSKDRGNMLFVNLECKTHVLAILFLGYNVGAGNTGMRNVTVGMAAVFDGHNGAEASEMASKLLFEYFMLHTHFLLDSSASPVMKKLPGLLGNNGASDAISQVDNCREESSWQDLDQERYLSC